MSTINQKEYLKKYLAIGKAPGEKRKKKKKEKAAGNRLKIIDDDVDIVLSQEIEEDLSAANEYAPQVVAVIDERPIALQIDESTKTSLWKPLGEPIKQSNTPTLKLNSFKLDKQVSDGSTKIKIGSHNKHINSNTSVKIKQKDYSRRSVSPYRRHEAILPSTSPARESDTCDNSPLRIKSESQNDYSPPRRKYKDNTDRKNVQSSSKTPVQSEEKDISPLRRQGHTPPRIIQERSSLKNSGKIDSSSSIKKYNDYSPARRRYEGSSDKSPSRKNTSPSQQRNVYKDSSPHRRIRKSDNEDNSPPRRRKKDDDLSRMGENDDLSRKKNYRYIETSTKESDKRYEKIKIKSEHQDVPSPRRYKTHGEQRKSRWDTEDASIVSKMKKTLDGKQAGLQNVKDVIKEVKHIQQKEDEMFKNMSEKVSGKNAATVIRGKKVKDLEEEAAKQKREQEMKEKYNRWGRGLKQVEDHDNRVEDELHEMSKPLARYADDKDLERFLKSQEREGDPMLDYIRKKNKKEKVAAGVPEKPMYMGEFMPNRFGIRPGFRWDGVDRSNGYERKYFQVQNAKKAKQEEAFKWSTEDM